MPTATPSGIYFDLSIHHSIIIRGYLSLHLMAPTHSGLYYLSYINEQFGATRRSRLL